MAAVRRVPANAVAVLLLLLLLVQLAASQGGSCQLPDGWTGTWFQLGLNTVRINGTSIETKGRCLESEGNYFLFEEKLERDERCYRCLFIVEKHSNVLQYKESYCEGPDTLENLCSLIPGDAQQYSMFKRDAAPVECPFRGSYTFTYSRGHGECRAPASRYDSCTENWRSFFRYQACPDVQGTESSDEQLECLATWKEGSLRYLMGRVQHQGAISDEDRYRCFVYEKVQPAASASSSSNASISSERHRTTILLAQSGDASCSGLTSPTEGSRTLKLTKVEAEGRRCRYPSWFLAHNHWHTLDGRWSYSLHKNMTLRIANVSAHGSSHKEAASSASSSYGSASSSSSSSSSLPDSRHEQKAVCHSMLELGENAARVVAHLSQGCRTGYVCMVFYHRGDHVVEFQAGEAAPAPEEACSPYYFNPVPGHYTTLIAVSHHSVACPLDGKFSVAKSASRLPCSLDALNDVTTPASYATATAAAAAASNLFGAHRTSAVAVGCSAPDTLDLYHECSRETSSGFLCRSTWTDEADERIKYVIATPMRSIGTARHPDPVSPKRICLTLATHAASASAAAGSGTSSAPAEHLHTPGAHYQTITAAGSPPAASASNNHAPLEWIVSSETCVRPHARDRFATHGRQSVHLSHNPHNLHVTSVDGSDHVPSTAAVFNVTSAGQCTGVEAAILDQRKLYSSASAAASLGVSSLSALAVATLLLLGR